MNPYNFVSFPDRIDRNKMINKHEKFNPSSISGYMECELETKTKTCIKGPSDDSFWKIGHQPIIPGSSIRGMIRTVCDVIGGGCGNMVGEHFGPYKKAISTKYEVTKCRFSKDDLKSCSKIIKSKLEGRSDEEKEKMIREGFEICPICSLFGLIADEFVFTSRISIYDTQPSEAEILQLRIQQLINPQPHHRPFYFKSGYPTGRNGPRKENDRGQIFDVYTYKGGEYLGRKFYLHADPKNIFAHIDNVPITMVNEGAKFDFRVDFENLTEFELSMMLFALQLEDGWGHKLGYGKPLGLGSVKIKVRSLYQRNPDYFTDFSQCEFLDKTQDIPGLINSFANKFKEKNKSLYDNLESLMKYKDNWLDYPSWDWFHQNPNATISDYNNSKVRKDQEHALKIKAGVIKERPVEPPKPSEKPKSESKVLEIIEVTKGKAYVEIDGEKIFVDNYNIYKAGKGDKIRVSVDKSDGKIKVTFKSKVMEGQ